MASKESLSRLREVISENLRVQRGGSPVQYISVGTALQDAKSKQNHAIFARRGCGKTLLLHDSARHLSSDGKAIYLNCEDFKRHSFPNVLIEILSSIFRELDRNLSGWFGKKARSKKIIQDIISKLGELQRSADRHDEEIRRKSVAGENATTETGIDVEQLNLKLNHKEASNRSEEIERSFKLHKDKLQELDRWLPELKESIRTFFILSSNISYLILQIDDLYHLKRSDQAFVVDYIHRLCKDLPIFFKIATLRHASTLYLDRDGQPIGAQERHDYQPINIDYTFSDFSKTMKQNWSILEKFGKQAGLRAFQVEELFKGEGFARLVMAGGGVPRDVLSLFLQLLNDVVAEHGKIGKDEVRQLSRQNFEQKIEELKQDSKDAEQDDLIKGIYIIRQFCLDKKTNIFLVEERMLQQNDAWRGLIYRLLDYRIIHNCATALTHKSLNGTYQAFSVDIGCYAHLRKLDGRFNEIDVSSTGAKEKMRSAPVLNHEKLTELLGSVPANTEDALLKSEAA
ncbi:hypothetical protein [Bosea sp. (in: a-proteobacteria)]|uniref:hypothetical protein n=1 Tax=Bosea sp. (in: a-proteobacteria) TaxID=1871050 RepID=UPI0025BB975F|nr:hypothetical protein [Bosea sp. (in: a-proteobacteria)]MBR3194111.1 hypothetical protein [Bosea sp. (in: a-proteobacteria)]